MIKQNLLYFIAAIQFVLSDEFSHLRPEQRLALLHVSKNHIKDKLVVATKLVTEKMSSVFCSNTLKL